MDRYIATPFSFINLLFDTAEAFLGVRFLFKLLGANAANWLVRFLYGVTEPLVAPFAGIFRNFSQSGFFFEWSSLIAMLAYGLLALAFARLLFALVSVADEGLEDEEDEEALRQHRRQHRHHHA